MTSEAITTWLQPLQPLLDPTGNVDWQRLEALADALDALLVAHPVGADLPPGTERSRRLRVIRRELAQRGHLDTTGEPALFQALAQFVCGYRDAAAIFDTVTTTLTTRHITGDLPRLRDSALVTVGHAHAQLVTALLGAVAASHLADAEHDHAETWAAAMKAHGVATANQTTAELALLLGATSFRADSPIAKTRRDLAGLLYADGIHDSLYRTAGKHHTTPTELVIPPPRGRPTTRPITA